MNKCVQCKEFSLKAAGSMARHGFGKCSGDHPGRYRSVELALVCARYIACDAETVAARAAWVAKLDGSRG